MEINSTDTLIPSRVVCFADVSMISRKYELMLFRIDTRLF